MAFRTVSKNSSILRLFDKAGTERFNTTRKFATFNFIDDKKTAEETVYFKKQEEEILARMLEKDPSLDPRYSAPSHELELFNDLALALSKFGLTDPPLALMEEVVLVFKNNGYSKK
ncbi:uncharacterized protein TA05035 [Theileria annulata]|uniref:Uncharacterized protein n=1 Tax=Theileria annulata TaxID=5874 RepID=Q4UBQ7_THEAN|nr:uncharacterized protein TA05035 [Theileria annulata]CAI75744.1 hypothetical protein, conserved [Theileria annulata]|eukprot:XP_955220.1 hypothetical protein, conserved [Theileria annulata]